MTSHEACTGDRISVLRFFRAYGIDRSVSFRTVASKKPYPKEYASAPLSKPFTKKREAKNRKHMSARLLLVDDEPSLLDAVQAYLEDSGFAVEVARNATEGWEKLQSNPPDLVVSDIMMPQVDGYQFLANMRSDPRFAAMPVIFLTARGMTADRIRGYEAGCDGYLPKPFDPDELVAIVKNVLGRRSSITTAPAEEKSTPELTRLADEVAQIKDWLTKQGAIAQNPTSVDIDLTPREQSVLDLVAQGLMNKEIARRLETSVRNVEKYVSRLFAKTGTTSRTELVRYALEHGLTS